MRVTTRSNNPHTRTAKTPYTEATIRVTAKGTSSADLEQRNQEMAFLALLVRVLNPRIGLRNVNEKLRELLPSGAVADTDGSSA